MKNTLIIFTCLFIFSFSNNAQTIPDTLRANLNAVEGHERLKIWENWQEDFVANDYEVWVNAISEACKDAYSILEADSALIWCFKSKMKLLSELAFGGQRKLSFTMLQAEKRLVDSLAEVNGGKHLLKAEWYLALANHHYSMSEEKRAVELFYEARDLFHELGIYDKDFRIYSQTGAIQAWVGNHEEAIKSYQKADSIGLIDQSVPFGEKVWLKYLVALMHSHAQRLEIAASYFDQVIPNLDSLDPGRASRAYVDYLNNLCQLGKTAEALEGFTRIETSMLEKGGGTTRTFAGYYVDCLMRAGKYEKASNKNRDFTSIIEASIMNRRDAELMEMETKFQTQLKEAKIKELELEKEHEKDIFKIQLASVGLIGLVGVGILAFLLYRNKNRRKQIELQRERDRQIAENRDRLFSSITHDIRTPLALMMAPLERIEGEVEKPSILADIHLAQRNGTRLMELFNQILDWNKAEAKALVLNNQVGQLKMTLTSLCSRFAQLASEGQIIFKHKLDIPDGQYSLDYDKMDKILSNLIGNAIKFCESGQQVDLEVKIEETDGANYLQLVVKDNGPGISETDQQNLFNRFYQGEQGKLKGGTGIGMALVHELVGIMKGEIKLTSELGKGTRFDIILPIKPVADMAITDLDSIGEEAYQQKTKDSKPLVLVVEDEPELLEFLHSALEGKYQVEKAGSATVGQNIAISRIPDIIISDWTLPDHTGGWLCKELRQNPLTSHIPVIILTAHTTDTHQQAAFDAGAVAWMNKPFKLDTLHRQLKTILDQQTRVQLKWSSNIAESISDEEQSQMDPFLEDVLKCIENNMADEYYGVEKMAEQLHLSRAQLFRKVKSLTGGGPSKLLTTYRLEKAKKMLGQPGQTVAEVAFAVGFSDPNYFSRVYKKHFDVVPTQDQS